MKNAGLFLMCLIIPASQIAHAVPPFSGTIFIDPDIITASDPTTFTNITYTGQGMRTMYDRRVTNFITVNAFLFNAKFDDGLQIEVQVNPEFTNSTMAMVDASKYAIVIGRLPTISRSQVQTVWIHKGVQPFGGGNNNLLIHTGQADLYEADGILEETFVHESSHTSLDGAHAASAGWLAAQTADPDFISTYARDNPTREDVAESFLPWLAVRHRPARIAASLFNTITSTIPHRLTYFDQQNFNMYPITQEIAVFTGAGTNAVNERADNIGTNLFANTSIGSTSATQTFTIRNRGGNNLTSLALTKTGTNPVDFVLGALGATTLAPQATTTFTVAFSPTASGPRNAVVNIASSDGDENPFRIKVSGYSPLAITQQPVNTIACLGSSAMFSVAANSPGVLFQWQRRDAGASNFVNLANATNANYTTPPVMAADDGAGFRVIVSGGGTNLTSSEALLSVIAVTSLIVSYNFNNGLPTNTAIYGDAFLSNNVLELNTNASLKTGAFLTPDLTPGRLVRGFTATFKARIISGNGYADGFSFNWATNLPNGPYTQAEEGEGSGLRVCFDTYDSGGNEAPGIDVKWGTNIIASYHTNNAFLPGGANDFADVAIRLNTNGTLDVSYRCVPIFTRLPLPGYTPLMGARFGLGGRTGTIYETHSIDDLALQLIADPATSVAPGQLRNVTRLGNGSVQFLFTNSPGASFTVLASTNVALSRSNWTVLGAPTEAPAGQYQFSDPQATNNPRRFYMIRSP